MLQEPVEVAAAEPISLRLVMRGPAPMLVPGDRQRRGPDRHPAVGAHREGQVKVGVAVEAEPVVEAADLAQRLTTNRQAVALNGVDLARRRLLELAAVRAESSPRAPRYRPARRRRQPAAFPATSPVGSTEVSNRTTTWPRLRRSPRLTASAQPTALAQGERGRRCRRARAAHPPARWRPQSARARRRGRVGPARKAGASRSAGWSSTTVTSVHATEAG